MQEVIGRKKGKEWQFTESVEVRLAHYEAKGEAKRVVSKVKKSKFKKLFSRLDTKEGISEVYRLAKAKYKKTRF